jgi:dTDP-4-dehydrorhamnose 3,5-epimerase-like enzyme
MFDMLDIPQSYFCPINIHVSNGKLEHVAADNAEVLYKTTEYWHKEHDRSVNYNDPELNIHWQITESPILSDKDQNALMFKDAELFE